jgi:riboflavin kinase / FMN adenylyltransferase
MRPTFGLQELVIETHVIQFDQETYGEEVNVELLHYLRSDTKFENAEQLVTQIQLDIHKSQELFNTLKS